MTPVAELFTALDSALKAIEEELVEETHRLNSLGRIVDGMRDDHNDDLNDDVIALAEHMGELGKALAWLSKRIHRTDSILSDVAISGTILGELLHAKIGPERLH